MGSLCFVAKSKFMPYNHGQDHNLPIEAIISKTHIGLPSTYLDLSQPCVYFVNLGLFFLLSFKCKGNLMLEHGWVIRLNCKG